MSVNLPTETKTAFDADGLERLIQSLDEPTWVTEKRRDAFATFENLGWPARSDEEWIRTDIRGFKLDRYGVPLSPNDATIPAPYLSQGVDLAGQVITLDSHTRSSERGDLGFPRGVVFGPLSDFVESHESKLRPYLFASHFQTVSDRFAALHAAFWRGGTVLYVPRGVAVERPFHLVSGMSDGGIDLSHLLVIIEEGASATLLCESVSSTPTSAGLHCGGMEMSVGAGANLKFVHLQDWGQGVWNFAHQGVQVDRDGQFRWTIAALGSRTSKVNQHVELIGKRAYSGVDGVLFTEGRQHLAYHTLQHHIAPSCRSDFLYKAALQDHSRTVWRGMIKVDAAAQKTDGYQRNDNLLLSTSARADSIPGLEIEADDVRCTHGSTTGKVDEEQIFYLCSRGFTRREAVRAIVTGFFQQIFDRVDNVAVRDSLSHAVVRRVREYE